jgi:DeoR/GlpR family transcriptional regulator of sugar metabolism
MSEDRRRGRGGAAQRSRQSAIAEKVLESGSLSVDVLIAELGVSAMTVYRDLADLETQGVLHRSRGMVTAAANGLFEASARYRMMHNVPQKEKLAAAASALVLPGQSVMLDDSSTCVWVARELAERAPLTIVTNSQAVLGELQGNTGIRLFMTGGEYQPWADACFGQTTVDLISGIRADFAIMSASAVTDGMTFHPDESVVQVKRAMLNSSASKVLCVDHSKFSRRALHAVASCEAFDHIFVDAATEQIDVERLVDLGCTVHVVE